MIVIKSTGKQAFLFFAIYVLVMVSIILSVIFIDYSPSDEIFNPYDRELNISEEPKEETKPAWTVSNRTAMIAVTIAAILDIVIVILWARRENRRLEQVGPADQKRWRDTKLFWNIVAMGMIRPTSRKYEVNWINVIGVGILLHLLFYLLFFK